MSSVIEFARLVAEISAEPDCERALERIAQGALALTASRYVMIAVLNESRGVLEIRYGAGEGWGDVAQKEVFPLTIGHEHGIVGFVAATGSAVQTGNVDEDPHYRRLFSSTQSEIAVPIRTEGDQVSAVLNMEADRRDAYGETEKEIVNALANVAGSVLQTQDHWRREEALIQIGNALDTAMSEESLVDRVIEVAENVLSFAACSIFLHDPRSDMFVLRGTIGALKDRVGEIGYERGEGFTGWVCEHGEPILLDRPQSDPRWQGKYVEIPNDEIVSFLAVPITGRSGTIGAIRALRRRAENPYISNRFTESDLRLFHAIAEQVATGLENVRNVAKIIHSERMIAWGELSAKSSHMIGNRVFALKGDVNELGHLVAGGQMDGDAIREIQRSLVTNVQRVEEILQDFRDFVTATQLERNPADINQIVRETVEEVFPKRTDVELQLELGDVPIISVDQKRIRRAISELIENSLNYVQSGRLRVATSVTTERLPVRRSRASRFVQIEVEDSGPGIDIQKKGLIFQPFYSGRVKGMGLGLSIVKGIADAHGGTVYEAGEPGEGARFVILLPIDD